MVFQSTHSLRSATYAARRAFNIADVSIHALLAECDCKTMKLSHGRFTFQSTHSLRSATRTGKVETVLETVSIHALLAECDPLYKTNQQ